MQKASFLTALVLAVINSDIFAAAQETTKATLFLGSSQNIAETAICLNGQSMCHGLRELKEDAQESGSLASITLLKPLNETSGNKEMVCFGPFPQRCYGYFERRLQDVVSDHRRLEVAGESQVKDIACFNQPWGLQCS